MRKLILLLLLAFTFTGLLAQPPQQSPSLIINNVTMPIELNKQVCISGMNFYNGKLYLASERCPAIFVLNPLTGIIDSIIQLQVPQEFEMEGLTSYKDRLYLVSENKAAIYEVADQSGKANQVKTSKSIPNKSKEGDGMEGITANEKNNKFYLLRERNEKQTKAEIYTYRVIPDGESASIKLDYESVIELPLENSDWRYSDISYDSVNSRLICLKSYSKGKLRQLFLESISVDNNGELLLDTHKSMAVENFTETVAEYKSNGYSTNLEGITLDKEGNIFIVSDNHSGKALCDQPAKEKTLLLQLTRKY